MDSLLGVHPFLKSPDDSSTDCRKFTMTKVQPEFFEGAANLDEGVVPGHDAIDALLEGHMFNDVARMAQGELHFVASHREDAAITSRQGGCGASEVGAIGSDSKVTDHIVARHDSESGVKAHAALGDTLVESLTQFAVAAACEEKIVAISALTHQTLHHLQFNGIIEELIVLVPLVNDAAPAGPTPDAVIGSEEIRGITAICGVFFVVKTRNHGDALVVGIAVEEFLAKLEETDGGHVVVLKDNAFVDL